MYCQGQKNLSFFYNNCLQFNGMYHQCLSVKFAKKKHVLKFVLKLVKNLLKTFLYFWGVMSIIIIQCTTQDR